MASDHSDNADEPVKTGFFARWRRAKTAVEPAPADSATAAPPTPVTPPLAPSTAAPGAASAVPATIAATSASPPGANLSAARSAPTTPPASSQPATTEPTDDQATSARGGRFRRALARTGAGFGNLFLGHKAIDAELFDELETLLVQADVGVDASTAIIATLTERVKRRQLSDSQALRTELRSVLREILRPCEQPLTVTGAQPLVVLVVGVNGVGKTTTIGKLAHRYQRQNLSVMLAAGDTFRAAAVEQLQVWGERNQVTVIAQHTGADSASVIFDAFQSARARGVDVLVADTAGRLHTKSNLMEELHKVKRVISRLDPAAPHEVLLVLDAGTGQNALVQTQQFKDTLGVTGIVLTKLDGTAKGGIAFALCQRFGIPIRYVGVGEGLDDLQPFSAAAFVDGLLAAGATGARDGWS